MREEPTPLPQNVTRRRFIKRSGGATVGTAIGLYALQTPAWAQANDDSSGGVRQDSPGSEEERTEEAPPSYWDFENMGPLGPYDENGEDDEGNPAPPQRYVIRLWVKYNRHKDPPGVFLPQIELTGTVGGGVYDSLLDVWVAKKEIVRNFKVTKAGNVAKTEEVPPLLPHPEQAPQEFGPNANNDDYTLVVEGDAVTLDGLIEVLGRLEIQKTATQGVLLNRPSLDPQGQPQYFNLSATFSAE